MTFLERAFLAALAAAVIPVVIHLLNRRKAPPVQFPTLRFLRELQVPQARRSQAYEPFHRSVRGELAGARPRSR